MNDDLRFAAALSALRRSAGDRAEIVLLRVTLTALIAYLVKRMILGNGVYDAILDALEAEVTRREG